ncbi:MAG: hypothetical protein ACFE96_05010 [Candidatus Hermodarchaeota archaeon]
MTKKVIAIIIITLVLSFSLIFTVPIVILSEEYSTYDKINEDISYYYTTINSSTTEILNLNIDRSDIEIKYVYPPNNFMVKIDVHFEISGANAQGKSYLDYFNIIWENSSSYLNFTMEYKFGIDPIEVLSLFNNISVIVILRADETIDLNIEMEDGILQQVVPFMVPINNIKVNNTYGTTILNFTNCVISGTISGFTSRGTIDLNVYNTQYTQNNFWALNSNSGEINLFITHIDNFEEMGANVTGFLTTNRGSILTVYRDWNQDIGAVFTYYNTTTEDGDREGFNRDINHDPLYMRYSSNDTLASYYYNFSLFKPLNSGDYTFHLFNYK